ncbi:MAG TPA: Ig-like domain-containing protein, partial [Gemmatimonadales bacterium]|nr:Ig-like domain-containing protein [Gemmatimonadales bacterium]
IAALGVVTAACASMQPPPGAPARLAPPAIILISPDSGAVLPTFSGDAVIQFDEVIDEMAQGTGGAPGTVTGLAKQIVLSPVAGPVKVSWHRSAIHIKPKEGWKPGRVYHLQLLPGIVDLHRNVLKRGETIIFSTGPALPTASLRGIALSWVEQHTMPQALIRAVLKPDTIAYLTYTDSTVRFRLDGIPPGQYVVYAVNDQNSNRARDQREAFDSITVTLDSTAATTLWTFVHDTTGPRLRAPEVLDSSSFRLTFTAALSPVHLPDTGTVHVYELPDTTPVAVSAVLAPAANDSLVARQRAIADSLRRAADTTHAAVDTTKKKVAAGRDTAARKPPAQGPLTHPGAAAAVDSTVIKLLATRPIPTDKLVVRTSAPLKPSTKYFIRVTGATNLNGVRADAVGVLVVPAPKKVPADSTAKVKADTAKAKPDSTKHP